ncbi:hypothetical protein PBAL39_25520 [Pedobacter sp. BAL39]|uniref:DUF1842 domain-containing protein n=1 Tax=Pedobacter sp. BAL39 TaxID=391596 RepID=UPI0001559631|nr:DUF1842 domain-containing protein [Pedobacter sp. BAL39]EDM36690.1 hypothetical protein PBAL39_25520 [Pedobacter sp. BAL39]
MPTNNSLTVPTELNFKIIGSDLFQPLLTLALCRHQDCSITGTAQLTAHEICRELNISYKLTGLYRVIAASGRIMVKIIGYSKNQDKFSIDMELDHYWNTGLASYRFENGVERSIKNAAVSRDLFTTMHLNFKSLWV